MRNNNNNNNNNTDFSLNNNSDSERVLAALQTAETTVVRTPRHRLDADKFPMFSVVVGPDKGFYRDLDPCRFEYIAGCHHDVW